MARVSEQQFLAHLQLRGIASVGKVVFKENRRTVYSLTQGGTQLNVHVGYSDASPEMFDAFATLLKDLRGYTDDGIRAREFLLHYPPMRAALKGVREQVKRRPKRRVQGMGRSRAPGPNAATPAQQEFLEALYAFFNETRFQGKLPTDIPLRLSSRMKRTLGWVSYYMEPVTNARKIRELTLNVDLMLEGNESQCMDTMLHEMAHVAAWVLSADRGHGRRWKMWARIAGCEPKACTTNRVGRRQNRRSRITRVPPLPDGAERFLKAPARPGVAARSDEILRPAARRESPETRPPAPVQKQPPAPPSRRRPPRDDGRGQFSLF